MSSHSCLLLVDASDEFPSHSLRTVALAKLLKIKTAGVPRLVTTSLRYLETKKSSELEVNPELLQIEEYRGFMREQIPSGEALGLYQSLDGNTRELYVELVRMAALRIPIDPEVQVDWKQLGYSASKGSQLPSLIELCTMYSVYCEKSSSGNSTFAK